MTASKWGNLYRVKKHGRTEGRTEAIEHFGRILETRPDLLEALGELDGAVLGCHCKEGEHCHGDEIIASWARHRGREARPRTSRVWGKGPPRTCERIEGPAGYHDGAGLASPGRWGPEERIFPEWGQLRTELGEAIVKELGGWPAAERLPFAVAVQRHRPAASTREPSDLVREGGRVAARHRPAAGTGEPSDLVPEELCAATRRDSTGGSA